MDTLDGMRRSQACRCTLEEVPMMVEEPAWKLEAHLAMMKMGNRMSATYSLLSHGKHAAGCAQPALPCGGDGAMLGTRRAVLPPVAGVGIKC
jgi:hypothetical protein